jgi:hypothetical protein
MPFAVELARRDNAKIVIAHVEQQIVGKGGGPLRRERRMSVRSSRSRLRSSREKGSKRAWR